MLRFAAAWVIVWGIFSGFVRADAGPDQLGSGSDYGLTPILSIQSQPVAIPPDAPATPVVQAPLPDAFWQGLACFAMLLVGWRLCRTVATR